MRVHPKEARCGWIMSCFLGTEVYPVQQCEKLISLGICFAMVEGCKNEDMTFVMSDMLNTITKLGN